MTNLGQCLDHDGQGEDEDYVKLIKTEIESGEDDVRSRSIRSRDRSVKDTRSNTKSDQVKSDILEAIATLKKYAQWKGKWDFIVSKKIGS